MARSGKEGISYFTHDVDMGQDIKIKLIKAKHGLVGYAVYLRLLEEIYRENGYFIKADEDFNILFCDDNKIEENVYIDILNDCIGRGLFNSQLHVAHKILTSARIQKNYIDATSRRQKIELIKEYLLINPTEYVKNTVNVNIVTLNVNIEAKNVNIGTQRKVKESKEKEKEKKEGKKRDVNIDFIHRFKNNIHPPTPIEADKLFLWQEEGMDATVICYAIDQAVSQGKRNMAYIEAILRNLLKEQITTIEAVEARERNRKKPPGRDAPKDAKYKDPDPGCEKCGGSGHEMLKNNTVRLCGCRRKEPKK